MGRKARGMEKVENLYCTARAQHVMPRRRDHVAGSGAAYRFKPSRPGGDAASNDACRDSARGPRLCSAPLRAALRPGNGDHCWRHELSCPGRGAAPLARLRASSTRYGDATQSRDPEPGTVRQTVDPSSGRFRTSAGPCQKPLPPLSDMSQFAAELCEYCADIAPIVPSLRGVP